MQKTTIRQRNYRLRKELEMWISYLFHKIKTDDPSDLQNLKRKLEELEETIVEYIQLNRNKGEMP